MRTTVDLPDPLYREAKVQAALRGVRLRDLIEEGLRRVLSSREQRSVIRRAEFPLHPSRRPGVLTAAAASDAEDETYAEEDIARGGAL